MKRKTLALFLVMVLILALAVPSMAARGNNGRGYGYGRSSHGMVAEIHTQRNGAKLLQYWFLELKVAMANAEIERLVAYAQSTPQNDVQWLVDKTNAVAAEVCEYAQSIGAVVECTYTEYYVDGEYVLIDPLRVVDLGSRSTKPRTK